MRSVSVDICIIGGGPAGLASAIGLAERGLRVAVCEKEEFPVDKPCGEGVMPEGVRALKRLGVWQGIATDQLAPILGICFINSSGTRAFCHFPSSHGYGVRRSALSQALYARALSIAKITFLPRCKALSIEGNGQRMVVRSKDHAITARLVIGADGLRSTTRRWALGGDGNGPLCLRYGMRKHFNVAPFGQHVEVYFADGLEAYVTPCGPRQINVAFLWHKKAMLGCKVSFATLLSFFPSLRDKLLDTSSSSFERAIGPLAQACPRPIGEGIALLGDASGYLDAITGEGLSLSFAQAEILSEIAEKGLRDLNGVLSIAALRPYEIAHKASVRKYYRDTKVLLYLSSRPRLMHGIIEVTARFPKSLSFILAKR